MKKHSINLSAILYRGLFCLLMFSTAEDESYGQGLGDKVLSREEAPEPATVRIKKTDEELYGPYKGKSVKELWKARSDFFKSGEILTNRVENPRLWQWWNAMEKADPAFGSKTPIEFYGKVQDQYGNSVSGATVDMSWGKETNLIIQTAADGSFSLSGITGDNLGVFVWKQGYLTEKVPIKHFEYDNFFDRSFHIPNPTNPVIFRLMKLEHPEPMYVTDGAARLDVQGTAVWIDVATGKKAEVGDIGFAVVRDDFPGSRRSGYTLTVQAAEGGGLVVTNDEFMFHAPETGYVPKIVIREKPGSPDGMGFHVTQQLKFYIKTADTNYAAMEAEVSQSQVPAAQVQYVIFFNPSGSRNLELGPDNRIDPYKSKPERGEPVKSRKAKAEKDKGKP